MTDVNKHNTTLVSDRAAARTLYAPPPQELTNHVGVEVEMALFRPGQNKPEIPSADAMQTMQKNLRQRGYNAMLEPSGVLEFASEPRRVENAAALVKEVDASTQVFEGEMEQHGFQRSPFSIMPTTTVKQALFNIVARERLPVLLEGMKDVYGEKAAVYGMLTTSVQTSFSPRDEDEMFRMAYRGYALTPLLFAAMNNGSGFVNNEPERQDSHLRGATQHFGTASGTAPSFLASSNAQEFVDNHIDSVFKAKMYFAYELDGTLVRPEKNQYFTFEGLAEKGLNTRANYELAETFIYNDIKICKFRAGDVVGSRVEVRAADSGYHQPASTLLLTAALVPDGPTASKFEDVLKRYGFTGDPKQDADLFINSRQAAVHHGGKFMDVAFGTGSMRDFAGDVRDLVAEHFKSQGVDRQLGTLNDLLTHGTPDAKAHREKFSTLQEVTGFLQSERDRQVPDFSPAVRVKTAPGGG